MKRPLTLDGFDDALLGFQYGPTGQPVCVYSYQKAIEVLTANDDMTYDEAVEHLEFNVLGAYVGDVTPTWVYDMEGLEYLDYDEDDEDLDSELDLSHDGMGDCC